MVDNDKILLMCDCSTEIMVCSEYIDSDKQHQEFNFAIYTYGNINSKPSFLDRLKYAWYHIKTGKKYEDNIILSQDKAKDLATFINDKIRSF